MPDSQADQAQAHLVRPRVTVLGSINMDLVIRCAQLPLPGQTVTAQSLREIPGGKGANQAVAAARSGGAVTMIGCVGDDGFGKPLRRNLIAEGITAGSIDTIDDCPSGVAVVSVDDRGENSIMVVPGANGQLTPARVQAAAERIESSDVLMVQLEIPLDAVREGIRLAQAAGVPVILDPAPAMSLPDELFEVDLICPNETEAAVLTGHAVTSLEDASQVARQLRARGAANVALTLGNQGTLFFDGTQPQRLASIPIEAVDTTAAGDAFAGALAVQWVRRGSLAEAIRWANVAGALSAARSGAQPSLPTATEIRDAWTNSSAGSPS